MKILIDIGHPAHVHYFKNLIFYFREKGCKIIVTARDREHVFELLNYYKIPYINRGKGKDTLVGKVINMFYVDQKIFKVALKEKPDIFLSFSSHYAAQVSFLLRKPHIAITDTEHEDKVHSLLTYPFSDVIFTPESYLNDLGAKQIRFKNVVEGLYLYPSLKNFENNFRKILGLNENEEYVILRFVSWKAHHDIGHEGISKGVKQKIIDVLKKKYRIFISSEDKLDGDLEKYRINIPSEKMHEVLNGATLYIGESSTMASESAQLGTKAIYINSLPLMCNIKIGEENKLIKWFKNDKGLIKYLEKILMINDLKETSFFNAQKMHKKFINPTKLLIWFIENYPDSKNILKNDPDYQLRFK